MSDYKCVKLYMCLQCVNVFISKSGCILKAHVLETGPFLPLKWDQNREFRFWEMKCDKSSKPDEILTMEIIWEEYVARSPLTDVANDVKSGNWIQVGGCVTQIGCLRPGHFKVVVFVFFLQLLQQASEVQLCQFSWLNKAEQIYVLHIICEWLLAFSLFDLLTTWTEMLTNWQFGESSESTTLINYNCYMHHILDDNPILIINVNMPLCCYDSDYFASLWFNCLSWY